MSKKAYKVAFNAGHISDAATGSDIEYWFDNGDITEESPLFLIDSNEWSTVGEVFDLGPRRGVESVGEEVRRVVPHGEPSETQDSTKNEPESEMAVEWMKRAGGLVAGLAIMIAAVVVGLFAGFFAAGAWASVAGRSWTSYRVLQAMVSISVIVFAWKTLNGTLANLADEEQPFTTALMRAAGKSAVVAAGWIAAGILITVIF